MIHDPKAFKRDGCNAVMATRWLLRPLLLLWVVSPYLARGLSISPPPRFRSITQTSLTALCASPDDENVKITDKILSENLIRSLDLVPLIRAVANHAGTRRGREALLSLVGEAEQRKKLSDSSSSSGRRRIIDTLQFNGDHVSSTMSANNYEGSRDAMSLVSLAGSAFEAREEYAMIEQALLALHSSKGLEYPPLYGAESSPWNTNTVDTDYDDWLSLPVIDDWTLEYVLQADQVVNNLLKVREWADNDSTKSWLPGLSDLGRNIPRDELLPLRKVIGGTVKVIRGRSLLDPKGKSSYAFRLNPEMFPTLNELYEREAELLEAIDGELTSELRKLKGSNESLEFQGRRVLSVPKSVASSHLGILRGRSETGGRCYVEPHQVVSMGDELASIQYQAHTMQEEIEQGLFQSIIKSANVIDAALQWMARLDVIFAKAAWGDTMNGAIPVVGEEGRIEVEDFVHPVLALSTGGPETVVPIDLNLSGDQGSSALIISGANGGGKTLALKSFGLVSVLCKLGIPVPSVSQSTSAPKIDFMDDVLVEVGDKQNVIEGESTLMARLNSCASVIQRVSNPESKMQSKSSLVLLDELGGGTDPNAGSAIAQAVLEKLIENPKCRIVATTHSPQLKALSLESNDFSCATVLMKRDPSSPSGLEQPTFQLAYGSIGDSHALAAAYRCTPTLPDDVLSRAADLMSSNDTDDRTNGSKNQIGELTQKLEQESQAASDARLLAEQSQKDSEKCRDAMLSLSEAYAQHMLLLEQRLDNIFEELNNDESKDRIDVVGDTLAELRVIKQKVKSDEELLRERGLKMTPGSYQFSDGESVVIIAKGEWEGEMAKIMQSDTSTTEELAPNEVLVMPSFASWGEIASPVLETGDQNPMMGRPLILKRYEVAVWDYDSVWDEDSPRPPATSVRESRRKLYDVLSSIKSTNDPKPESKSDTNKPGTTNFISSRQRKAANAKEKKNKKSKKRRKK